LGVNPSPPDKQSYAENYHHPTLGPVLGLHTHGLGKSDLTLIFAGRKKTRPVDISGIRITITIMTNKKNRKKTTRSPRAFITGKQNFKPSTYWSKRQKNAIDYGYELTDRLRRYTRQALGLEPSQVETKRHTVIWSGPGAGKTFTVNSEIRGNRLRPLKFHGMTSMNAFAIAMAVEAKFNSNPNKLVWVDDCDGFFMDNDALNIMKGVLDEDRNVLGYNINMGGEIAKAEKAGNQEVVAAISEFSTAGVGMEIPTDDFRFIITTNKKLANKRESMQSERKMHEHAIRDRVNFRQFDITDDEAWGWMASNMLSSNVFKDKKFKLTQEQTYKLLDIFYNNWKQLSANSMRTVMEAGAMLYNNPETFTDEFEQNFL